MITRTEAERILVGKCILGEENALSTALSLGVEAKHFRGDIPRLMFRRLTQLLEQKAPIDSTTIMPDDDSFTPAAIAHAIGEMTTVATSPDNIVWYAEELKRHVAEEILTGARRAASQAIASGVDIQVVSAQFKRSQTDAAELTGERRGFTTVADHVVDLLEQIDSRRSLQNAVFTGYPTIDGLCVALMPGDLVILAGRPSMGKTALCLDILHKNAHQQIKSMLVSMEQSPISVAARMLAKEANMSTSTALRTPERLKHHERETMLNSAGALFVSMPYILLMEKARPNIGLVEDAIKQAVDLGARLVAIDYLQLIKRKGGERPDLEIAENCETIKAVGKECGIPIILLAQLNRGNEKDNRAPKASDLRDSGGIEQAADFIWFPHCKHEDAKKSGERYFIQEKGRDAGVGFGKLYFQKETASFHELNREESEYEARKFSNANP